jgi:hypothetical protein
VPGLAVSSANTGWAKKILHELFVRFLYAPGLPMQPGVEINRESDSEPFPHFCPVYFTVFLKNFWSVFYFHPENFRLRNYGFTFPLASELTVSSTRLRRFPSTGREIANCIIFPISISR